MGVRFRVNIVYSVILSLLIIAALLLLLNFAKIAPINKKLDNITTLSTVSSSLTAHAQNHTIQLALYLNKSQPGQLEKLAIFSTSELPVINGKLGFAAFKQANQQPVSLFQAISTLPVESSAAQLATLHSDLRQLFVQTYAELSQPGDVVSAFNLANYHAELQHLTAELTQLNGLFMQQGQQLRADKEHIFVQLKTLIVWGVVLLSAATLLAAWWSNFGLFNPLQRLYQALHNANQTGNAQLQLPEQLGAELSGLANVVGQMHDKLHNRIEIAKLREMFNQGIRHSRDPDELRRFALEFFATHYAAPSVAICNTDENTLIPIQTIGCPPCLDNLGIQYTQLCRTLTRQSLDAGNAAFEVKAGAVVISIKSAALYPLLVNNQLRGALYIASVEHFDFEQQGSIQQLCEDLAIQIQLCENAQQQLAAETALSQHLEMMLHILNAIPNPTYYRDIHGTFLGVNRAFLDFLDLFEAEVTGMRMQDVFDVYTTGYLEQKSRFTIEQQAQHQFELTLENGQQESRELIVHEAPFFDGYKEVGGVVGTFLDMTERNELERNMLAAKELADKNAKVKSEFLANMSHEIRSPMNAIIGMAHLALNTQLDIKQRSYVEKIDNAAKQLLKLLNDILDFSKIEAGKVEIESTHFQLDKVLDNVATIVGLKADEKQLELIFDVHPDVSNDYIGDPLRISQVLINLAGNAVKFTEQGHVTVNISYQSQDEQSARLLFSVIDTGIGLSQEQQTRLFQSFAQADTSITRKYGGTGLGLTISQHLVKLMGGEIFVESELGRGSTFYFTLPLPFATPTRLLSQPAEHFKNKMALVVDDNALAREVMAAMLKKFGIASKLFSSGDACIEYVRNQQPHFDIAFIDWHMPQKDGIDTIMELHAQSPASQYALVTAYGRELGLKDEQKHIISSILLKPINPSSVFDCLQACLAPQPQQLNTSCPAQDSRLSGLTILVAEDQPVNQEIAVEILSFHGATVAVANNGQEALNAVQSTTFDIVLMDMQMPVMDGLQATRAIGQLTNTVHPPILAMTANAMQDDIQTCLDAGMVGHIAKPIDVENMVATILAHTRQQERDDVNPIPVPAERQDATEQNTEIEASTFDGIDIEAGINRAAGNREVYFSLLEKFVKQQIEELINLKQAITIGNTELAEHILHALKGASANLSMTYLTGQCAELESQLKNARLDGTQIDNLLDYIRDCHAQVTHHIESDITHVQNAAANSTSDTHPEPSEAPLIALTKALREYDSYATELVASLHANAPLPADVLDELKTLITQYEFEKAHSLLEPYVPQQAFSGSAAVD
ncbi:two-component system, unclassified family, sensor histidine kinase and response regulator [Pseudoalteromonas rubra]|uniref:Sensory/regulatory protein RpfC n=1 Tax=Pseudoalteromonas rubra TaxID=43658 RepID=A0A8T0C978_9GAMM|nr:PAS domain-containing hybrid sensor histidine kinase/response regulator [Pseudoalteromonas rubra]KAF7787246.1 two-component system, unclassified family, sensor histidine kinase and response regulator [Pseudoalteromonas rubra]